MIVEGSPQYIALTLLKEIGYSKRVLDVGCGDGELALEIIRLKLAQEIYGVDIDEELLSKARERGIITFRVNLEKDKLPFSTNILMLYYL